MKRAPWRDTFFVTAIVALVRVVYLLSSPFVMEGDGHHYHRYMLEPFSSNLLHASGYPFLMHFTVPLSKFLHVGRFEVLRAAQQLVPIAACALFHRSLTLVASRWAACLATVLVGTNFMSVTEAGLSMPEFLLESWLLLLIALLVVAGATSDLRRKQALYLAAGPLFACGYLIKYNFTGFATLFGLLLLDRALPLVRRFALLALAGVGGAVVIVSYIVFFHQPTTGSYALNLEHGWVHMLKLHRGGFVPKGEYGPATQKFLILTKLLPKEKQCCSQNFLKIDSVSDAEREPYRRKEGQLLALTDRAEIQRRYEELGRPVTPYAEFQRLYYYLGLYETESLLQSVFLEAAAAEPGLYLTDVAKYVREGLWEKHTRYQVRVPIPDAPAPLSGVAFSRSRCHVLPPSSGKSFLPTSEVSCPGAFYFGPTKFWIPGLWFSLLFALPHLLPVWCYWPVVLMGAVPSLRRWKQLPERFHLISLLAMFAYAVFSSVLYQIRQKELVLLQPFFVLGFVLGLNRLLEVVKQGAVPRVRVPTAADATI